MNHCHYPSNLKQLFQFHRMISLFPIPLHPQDLGEVWVPSNITVWLIAAVLQTPRSELRRARLGTGGAAGRQGERRKKLAVLPKWLCLGNGISDICLADKNHHQICGREGQRPRYWIAMVLASCLMTSSARRRPADPRGWMYMSRQRWGGGWKKFPQMGMWTYFTRNSFGTYGILRLWLKWKLTLGKQPVSLKAPRYRHFLVFIFHPVYSFPPK